MSESNSTTESRPRTPPNPGKRNHPGTHAGQFGVGRDPRENVKKRAENAVPVEVEAVGVEGLAARLGVMRKVLAQRKCDDRGSTERILRDWLERDTRGYLREVTLMEEQVSGGSSEARSEDAGRDRASGACEVLLAAWAKGDRS